MSDRMAQLTKMLDADPNDPFITYALAMEHRKADALEDAVKWFDRTIALDADYFYAYFHKARALDETGETETALACARIGLERALAGGDGKASGELEELIAAMD